MRYILAILALSATLASAEDYIIATGENGTEEAYVADRMVYSNWLSSAVLWMPFPAEKLAGTYYDYSLAQNDGTQATAGSRPTWTNSWGGAYVFDGAGDWITIPQDASLEFGSGSFSVSAWSKQTIDTTAGIMGYGDRSDSAGWTLVMASAGTSMIIDDGSTQVISTDLSDLTDGVWRMFVATINRESNILSFYVNGALIDSDSIAAVGSLDTNDHDEINIGRYWFSIQYVNYKSGSIDAPTIYTTALSSNQVYAAYMAEPTIAKGGKR